MQRFSSNVGGPREYTILRKYQVQTEENIQYESDEGPVWFAMRATFGRELKAKSYLESKQIECFIPMRYEIVKDRTLGKIRKLVPAISNLMFVYTTKERIKAAKSETEYIQYITKPVDGRRIPITIPEHEMRHFMAACETLNSNLVYLAPEEISLEKGTPVRIIGSAFDGIEGHFVKVNKKRKKQVVVLVQGLAAVMIAKFDDGYLQVIED